MAVARAAESTSSDSPEEGMAALRHLARTGDKRAIREQARRLLTLRGRPG